MTRKNEKKLISRHVQFFEEDWELLDELYGLRSRSQLGVGKAIRRIVQVKCQGIRARRVDSLQTDHDHHQTDHDHHHDNDHDHEEPLP